MESKEIEVESKDLEGEERWVWRLFKSHEAVREFRACSESGKSFFREAIAKHLLAMRYGKQLADVEIEDLPEVRFYWRSVGQAYRYYGKILYARCYGTQRRIVSYDKIRDMETRGEAVKYASFGSGLF